VPIDDGLLLGSAVSAALLVLFFFVLWPSPRASVLAKTTLAILVPIAFLSGYLVVGYRTWDWGPLGYGSAVPWLVAALLSAVMLWRVMSRSAAPVVAKVVVGVLSGVSWLFLSATAMLYIACTSGDCL
jgi:hypothetical protein